MSKEPNNKNRFKRQSRLIKAVEIYLWKPVGFSSFLFKHVKISAVPFIVNLSLIIVLFACTAFTIFHEVLRSSFLVHPQTETTGLYANYIGRREYYIHPWHQCSHAKSKNHFGLRLVYQMQQHSVSCKLIYAIKLSLRYHKVSQSSKKQHLFLNCFSVAENNSYKEQLHQLFWLRLRVHIITALLPTAAMKRLLVIIFGSSLKSLV